MKPEAQRVAIAKACGWVEIVDGQYHAWVSPHGGEHQVAFGRYTRLDKTDILPDYLSDLNAMHEAEKTLTDDQQWDWQNHIVSVLPQRPQFKSLMFYVATATAAQRAEAFLRTLQPIQSNDT